MALGKTRGGPIEPNVISKEVHELQHALLHEDEESIREVIRLFVKEITVSENEMPIAYRFSFPEKSTNGKSLEKCNPKKSFKRMGQQPAFVDKPVESDEIADNNKNVGLVMVPKGGVERCTTGLGRKSNNKHCIASC